MRSAFRGENGLYSPDKSSVVTVERIFFFLLTMSIYGKFCLKIVAFVSALEAENILQSLKFQIIE